MPIYIDVKHYYETTKNGKLVRRKDIEKEEPTHLPPQKRPTNKLNLLKDLRHRIIWGNADLSEFNLFFFYSYTEWPTLPKISHLKIKNPKDSKEEKKSEQVWLAEATYQVFLKLNDWLAMSTFNEILQNLISLGKPFTGAIETIENTAREIQNILPSALPNYESCYERGYETFKGVLYNLDKSNDTVVERLSKFQSAVKGFESLILMIHYKIIRTLTRHNSIKSDSDNMVDKNIFKLQSQEKVGQDNIGNTDSSNGKPSVSKGALNIHIKNFQGILGDVQAENVQTGDKSLIHTHTETEKKKKGIFRNLWLIITAVVGFLGTLLGILNHLEWLESFKAFCSKLFTHK